MPYATYSFDKDIAMSKSCLSAYPSHVEQRVEKKDFVVNYVNIGYSVINSQDSNLQYKGQITLQEYPLSMMKKDIKELLKSKLNYDISAVHVSELKDDEEKFTVLTMELTLDNLNYSKIIDEEYEISEELELYEKNIILRLV